MAKILIIDDDDSLRRGLEMVLKLKGYQPLMAADAESGLTLAREQSPDLIVSDIDMPGMTGLEALVELRNDVATSAIPFILMTGKQNISVRDGMDLGADDFLHKPLSFAEILKAVEARLSKQRAVRTAADRRLSSLRASLRLRLPKELTDHLNEIISNADILQNCADNIDGPMLQKMSGDIQEHARCVQSSIRNFILFVQLETIQSDHEEISALRAQLTANAEAVIVRAARSFAKTRDREPDLDIDLQPTRVEMATDLLTKIIEEIISNACKFSEPGSPIRITNRELGRFAIIEIADRGFGMNSDELKAVDAYVRFDKGGVLQPGLGLGLSICKRLADLHGGSLEIKSVEEQGTTVSINLPAKLHLLREDTEGESKETHH